MNLKNQYLFSSIGIILASFGAGWIMLASILSVPKISWISGIGVILIGLGLAITIKTMTTIKKIDLEFVEDD